MTRYAIDPTHSTLGFSVKHLAVATVRGSFEQFSGTFEVDDSNPSVASGEVTIQSASITTGVGQRDTHLRSGDFFEAEKFPEISYRLTGVEAQGDDRYVVRGDLTIKGITQPIELQAELEGRVADPFSAGERVAITATGQLNRMDYGLNWNGLAGAIPMAGHTIKVQLDLALVSQVAAAEAGVAEGAAV